MAGRMSPSWFAAETEKAVLGSLGFRAEQGECVRYDVFRRRVVIELDRHEKQYHGRNLIEVFLGIECPELQDFQKVYGSLGTWVDVYRAVHWNELAAGERGWYLPAKDKTLPSDLVDDLAAHSADLLDYPGSINEMVALLVAPDPEPIRNGLSIGQFSGSYGARLLKALILARWSEQPAAVELATNEISKATQNSEIADQITYWAKEYRRHKSVDVSL